MTIMNTHERHRQTLMDEAARYRERTAQSGGSEVAVVWDCDRGHAWDNTLDAAQNVRCMNCASQRRAARIAHLHDIADTRGGVLVSEADTDAATPLVWECAYGHRWSANAHRAQRYWCTECARSMFAAYR